MCDLQLRFVFEVLGAIPFFGSRRREFKQRHSPWTISIGFEAFISAKTTRAEINLVGRLMHDFRLSGEERMEVEMYLDEKVSFEEARRVTRQFLTHARSRRQRNQLVATVEQLLGEDGRRTQEEQEWLQELHDTIAESSGNFLLDVTKAFRGIKRRDELNP